MAAKPRLARAINAKQTAKFLTKDELRSAAMRELSVSKSAFDFGWTAAIEDTDRHHCYEPLRRRLRTNS
jgi:hypothetical protein